MDCLRLQPYDLPIRLRRNIVKQQMDLIGSELFSTVSLQKQARNS